MKTLILRYGEINLKGNNRNLFERALLDNLNKKLNFFELKDKTTIIRKRNRIFIDFEIIDEEKITTIATTLPGIENYSITKKIKTDLELIKQEAINLFDKTKPNFRVTVKRSYKEFPKNSQELAKDVGASILIFNDGLKGMKVSMKDFEQEIGIEVHQDNTYLYNEKKTAMGGLPIGSSGKGLVLLSGGIDSPVACIEAMKRGIKIDCIHFSTPPYTTEGAKNKVQDLVQIIRKFDPDIQLLECELTNLQLLIKEKTEDKYSLLLMRRMMYRKASSYALNNKYSMIITGESIGQVASQTIESITMTNMVSLVPVIRPLITFNKNEIITIARKYSTYETSIMPFEDACTVFAPKKPIIKPTLENTLKEEEKIDYETELEKLLVKSINKNQSLIDSYL